MEIIVCIKCVPITSETELIIDESKKGIKTDNLVFDINEWDEYALEEAVRIKEKFGGSVTIVTVSSMDVDDILRKCLAKGADKAIKVINGATENMDGYVIAKILHNVIKNFRFDLILCGAQASDDGYSVVGVMLASLLGIPYSTMVKKIEVLDDSVRVTRELEEGLEEIVEIELPALLTIQTGINEPRYASISSIRRFRQKEITVIDSKSLDLEIETSEGGPWICIEELSAPVGEKRCEFISGGFEEIASKVVKIMSDRGLLK